MNRRRFVQAGLATAGFVTIAGCADDDDEDQTDDTAEAVDDSDDDNADVGDEDAASFPSHDLPRYSGWIPSESHDGSAEELFFTHLDWEAIEQLDSADDSNEDDETEEVIDQIPIIGLPLYGGLITPFTLFGILFYPFAGDVLPEEGETSEGVGTSSMTWTDDLVIFHGEFDLDVFAEQYTDGFEEGDEQNGFTVYTGDDDFTEGLAYAVSDETLVVGMTPGEDDDYVPEDVVSEALDRYIDETGRLVDDEEGQWLFETTGEAQMSFGAWQTEDIMAALDPDDEVEEDVDEEPDTEPDVEDNPVFDDVESLINNIIFTVEDGEMRDIEARFSGLYPDDAVPSEDDVREHLIGEEDVPHEIVIEGNRVHATATFEEVST